MRLKSIHGSMGQWEREKVKWGMADVWQGVPVYTERCKVDTLGHVRSWSGVLVMVPHVIFTWLASYYTAKSIIA